MATTISAYQIHCSFSGKEKDSETGYHYFGARYYNSDLSLWLSVDPMSDKYPSLSPYNYCAWNPMKLVDPDGMEMEDDIVIRGSNNSSITVKTDLINKTFDVNHDFGGNFELEGEEVLSAALDLGGVADPSGVCDIVNISLQTSNGDIGGAVISTVSIIPYVGDLAKIGKIGKDFKIIEKAIKGIRKGKETKGLGNPFKGKTLHDVDKGFQEYVKRGKLKPARGSADGNKAYVNTKSGYSYNLDPGRAQEGPHVDVNYPHGSNKQKKKLPVAGGF